MRRQLLGLTLLVVPLILAGCGMGVDDLLPQPETADRTPLLGSSVRGAQVVPEQFIVGVQSGVDPQAAANAIANRNNGQVLFVYEHAFRGFALQVPSQAVEGIRQNPNVAFVEPDLKVEAFAQTLPAGIDRIEVDQNSTANVDGVDDAMDVDIAVIDTGIDLDHPDLDAQAGEDCIDDGKSTTNDDNGHGTHVAGTAAAIDDDSHVVGAAPGARVHAVKVLDADGGGTISSVICGIDYVTANADTFEVANMSLGAQGQSESMRTAIQNSVDAGVYYAVAAGNDALDVYGSDGTFDTSDDIIPAAYPEVAAVSAMADFDGASGGNGGSTIFQGCGKVNDDTFADCFSNFSQSVVSGNPVSSPGAAIDVAAPGVSVLSTWNDGGTNSISGTSMSSPHVAGSAALYIVENGLSPSSASDVHSIRQALIDNAQAQSDWGPSDTNDPDSNPEGLVYWGSGSGDGDTDDPPSVTITNPIDGDTVSGTVTVEADASDDDGVDQVEFFVDGGSIGTDSDGSDGWSTSWDTTTVSDGDHTVSAEATDTAGQTASDGITVSVDNTTESADGMHVGDLDGNSSNNGRTWTAEVTITVHDPGHNALSGADVSGDWSTGDTATCTTDSSGQCTVSLSGLRKNVSPVSFTVSGVSHPDYSYSSSDNHDPDGDSDGTTISVSK